MLDSLNNTIDQGVQEGVSYFHSWLGLPNGVAVLSILLAILVAGIAGFYLFRFCLLRLASRFAKKEKSIWIQSAYQSGVFQRISWLIPGMMMYVMVPLIELTTFAFASTVESVVGRSAEIYIILVILSVLFAMLNTVELRYRRFKLSRQYAIKSYLQVVKIVLASLTAILVVAVLMDQSPIFVLTGLGAMTAVISLIFRDTILGFVASIQLTAYDLVRIGDWIEMPVYGVDGDVIDISLNTIKIQNFDKTIVTIPSTSLLSNGVKNWRGMSESGGRRIKRSIYIDVNYVKLCDKSLLDQLSTLSFLKDRLSNYVTNSPRMLDEEVATLLSVDTRCVSNLALLRLYVEGYLAKHPKIHQGMTFMVRELQDTGKGIPLEIYIFTNETTWVNYENIQSDIFDYLYAVLPLFELKAYQAQKLDKDDMTLAG